MGKRAIFLGMKLKNILSPTLVKVHLAGNTKQEIIKELLDLLVADGKVLDADLAFHDMMEREKTMSTGIQHGVAIPHAKTKAVKDLVACIGIKPEGVDFQSLDGEPSKIFIMTLSPYDRVGPHVQFLAEISMVIKTPHARARLINAKSVEEVLSVFGL
jgi:mannitol/fructose-specific phosphotransferase system IIA component (Ntr-type)